MGQTAAQVLGVELEAVAKKVPWLFDREDATFYAKVEKRPTEKVSDRDMRLSLEMRPGGRFGHYDPNGGDMGRGDASQFDKAVISSVHLKYAVEWNTQPQWATDDSRKAVLDVFKHNLAKAMPEMRRGFDALCQTSGNGVLGVVSALPGGTNVINLDSEFGAKLLRYGQYVNVYDTTLATNRTAADERQIILYDLPNKQIQLSGAAISGLAVTDKIVISGVSGASPVSMLGVPYHHNASSSGLWLGFNRATTPEIRANQVDASSSTFQLPFARLAVNKMLDRIGSDEQIKLSACMHPCQVQVYEQQGQLIQTIFKEAKEEGLNLYFNNGNMQLAGAPIQQYFMWSKKRIDFIRWDYWGRAELHPAGFYDVEGRRIFEVRGSTGGVATSQIFYLVASFNLFMNNPAGGLYIPNLAIPSGY